MTGPSAVGVATSDRTISTYESLDKGFSAFEKETGIRGNRKWDSGSRIECVGFVRAVRPDSLPSTMPSKTAKDMWTNAVKDKWQIGQTPVPGAVMCWKGWPKNTAGHVAIVTDVAKDGAITVWDANWSSSLDGKIRKRIVEDLTNVQGYIYAKESDVPPILRKAASGVEQALEVLLKVDASWTYDKLIDALPAGTHFSRPEWVVFEYQMGNVVEFSGKLNGYVAVMSSLQRRYVLGSSTDPGWNAASIDDGQFAPKDGSWRNKFAGSDRILELVFVLSSQPLRDKSFGETVISQIARRVGKPLRSKLDRYVVDDFVNPGWTAEWELSKKRGLRYLETWLHPEPSRAASQRILPKLELDVRGG